MIDNFMAGEYDLMGGTYYLEGMEEYFSYPDYNAGYGKSLILARRNDSSIRTYDWKSMNGKTIGVYENARENIRRLKQFIESNAIDCTIKYYNKDQLFNGNLYPYLESGEIDMLLLGPHLKYMYQDMVEYARPYGVPVHVIDQKAYGTLDGAVIVDFVVKELGK